MPETPPLPPPHGFAFTDQASFLKAPRDESAGLKPFGLAGLCWDGCVTNRPGARFGPRAIRAASHMLCDGIHPHFNVSPLQHLTDLGDLPLPNTSLEAMRAALAAQLPALLDQRHMVWLGGDHSVTLPLLRALKVRHGRPLAVIHFDAHCDTWEDHFGEPSGHGTWVYEAFVEGLVEPACFTQLGIRSSGERAAREYVRDQGGQIFTARDLRGLESPAQLAAVMDAIRQRQAAQDHPPVYLSLDIDCLDPAFAPGTGTPEPGGMSSNQVLSLLEGLADLPFVGMDCVEVAPPYDHAEMTANAAAHFVWTYLSGQLAKRKD
ncbi:agmatinase [Ideonella livida]|uniref:Agmatinase n=1 Tax=Ideonella livida TaxID=2707176 RepID=A0A7C9PFJ4_9BURK|nr:agmatinase [Ideonella livida]NDY90409.1 agmatinase [Ideonella livida]